MKFDMPANHESILKLSLQHKYRLLNYICSSYYSAIVMLFPRSLRLNDCLVCPWELPVFSTFFELFKASFVR